MHLYLNYCVFFLCSLFNLLLRVDFGLCHPVSTHLKTAEEAERVQIPFHLRQQPSLTSRGYHQSNPMDETRQTLESSSTRDIKRQVQTTTESTPGPFPQRGLQVYQHHLGTADLHRLMLNKPPPHAQPQPSKRNTGDRSVRPNTLESTLLQILAGRGIQPHQE